MILCIYRDPSGRTTKQISDFIFNNNNDKESMFLLWVKKNIAALLNRYKSSEQLRTYIITFQI
jgi:hypothetical protein